MEVPSSPPDLLQIWNLEAESEDFEKFVTDPSIPKTTKAEGLQAILNNMDVSDLTKRFLREPGSACRLAVPGGLLAHPGTGRLDMGSASACLGLPEDMLNQCWLGNIVLQPPALNMSACRLAVMLPEAAICLCQHEPGLPACRSLQPCCCLCAFLAGCAG